MEGVDEEPVEYDGERGGEIRVMWLKWGLAVGFVGA